MKSQELIIIGGGEAGISAALRSAALGGFVTIINRGPELGGGCVRGGTLPGKTLSNAAQFLESLKSILDIRHKTTLRGVGVLSTKIRRSGIGTGARAEDIKDMVYGRPTYSEGFGKAAAEALKKIGL